MNYDLSDNLIMALYILSFYSGSCNIVSFLLLKSLFREIRQYSSCTLLDPSKVIDNEKI